MKDRTRLALVSVLGVVGIVGQVALLWTQLPKETNEIVRREAERRLEGVAERFPEELRGLAAISGARLATAAHSPILAALPGGSGPEDLAQGSELARRLAEENELSELVILDAAGLVRSAYPDVARVGLAAKELLTLARQSQEAPQLAPFDGAFKSGADKDPDRPLFALTLGRAGASGRLWLFSRQAVTRRDLEGLALRLQANLGRILGPEEATAALAAEGKMVALSAPGGERLLTLGLSASGLSAKLLQRLLDRQLLFWAVPWALFFIFLIAWLGWPPRKARPKERS